MENIREGLQETWVAHKLYNIQSKWKLLASGCDNVWEEDMDAIILWDVVSGSQLGILKG